MVKEKANSQSTIKWTTAKEQKYAELEPNAQK